MIKNLLIKALNKTVSLDPESFDRLKKLDKKIFSLTLLPINLNFRIQITSAGFENCETGEPDIEIEGKPSDFIKLAQHKNIYGSGVKIHGDMGLAEELKKILVQMDLDWEALIAEYTGDIPARQLSLAAKHGSRWIKSATKNFQENLVEYFQEELRILPTRVEMDLFKAENAALRDDLTRLEAKLK